MGGMKILTLKLTLLGLMGFLIMPACKKEKSEEKMVSSKTPGKTEIPALSSQELKNSSQIESEKEKALKNPYPNDLGPDHIDISKYGTELQEGYHLLINKCAKCHSASRPLNSQFVELSEQEITQAKKAYPEIYKDKLTWQIESGIWQRYVKRMMAKPGCNISSEEGKKIWKFLVEDSKRRKTGSDAKTWETYRKNLIAQFKAKHPERYQELFPSAK